MSSAPSRAVLIPREQFSAADAEDAVLTWTVHLMRRQPQRLTRITACALAVFVCGLLFFHNPLLALLPVFALLLSLAEYLLPVRYTLTRRGAQARGTVTRLEMSWADVKHAYLADDGIKLSPLARKDSRFERMRGIFLRFDGGNDAIVTETVRQLREAAHG